MIFRKIIRNIFGGIKYYVYFCIPFKGNISRSGAVAARWAHNPKVVGSNPAPAIGPLEQWFISSPCHGEDRQFKSDMDRKMAR